MGRLVRIRAEQPPPLQAVLEGDVDRRTVRLEHIVPASRGRRVGRLAERAQKPSAAAEDPDVRCERVGPPRKRLLEDCFVIAVVSSRQTVPGLQYIDLEGAFARCTEGDAGREIEPCGKDTDYIAGRDADVLTMARVVQGCFSRAQWIGDDRRVDRQRKHTRECEDQPDADNTIAPCERRFPSSVRTRSEPPHDFPPCLCVLRASRRRSVSPRTVSGQWGLRPKPWLDLRFKASGGNSDL